jgi:hypothetical protein
MSVRPRVGERGSAAGLVAVLLLALLLALAAYVAWGLLLTPHLTGVSPDPAAEKTAVFLQGSRFASSPGANIVLFGDQTGRVLRTGPTELEVQVPDLGLPPGRQARVPVRVLVDGRVSEVVELTIGLPPSSAPTPTPTPEPPPSPEAVTAVPGPPPPSASPAIGPKPRPTPTTTPGTGKVLAEAEAAATAGDFGQAAQLYGQALQQEPANAKAKAGLESAQAALAVLARTFVLGKTQVEGTAARSGMKAFDTRDVSVRKPPEVGGRLEIVASPSRVKPGDPVRFQVFLQNEGNKPIKVQALSVATTVDTVRSSAPATPLVKEVAARQRALVLEISETWKPVANRWRLEVQITSDKGETYTNLLSWK